MHIPSLLERQAQRCPVSLVDVASLVDGVGRLTGSKAVSASEDYFQGHFPGAPLMPGVLMLEALTQASTLMLLGDASAPEGATVRLRGVDDAKFRRHVVPGDRLDVDVQLLRRRGPIARVQATARVDGTVVIEARLVLAVSDAAPRIHPSAIVHPSAVVGDRSVIGPGAVIGPYVVIGRHVQIGASAVVEGDTTVGDHTRIFPFASIGLPPQDLKYRGERTRLVIGHSNVFRESVTIHRGTVGGGGETRIGDRNLFMAYAHVAHDCHVGSDTIFGPGATLGGHVVVEDFAQISAYSGVHQFCRVGRYAFIGGYSVVTLDALPFAKTVGNRARVYGLNTIGLVRRGFTPEVVSKLKRAYRYLLTSRLTPSKALQTIDAAPELACADVAYLVDFIRSSSRGVTLRRPSKRADDAGE
ncbi:MAG: acyl-ACP--UDP-N-acetylglucosamine O-acyltransferase [Acidobacteria bacterium]|nr:acyl-ACP--UDP-N-acetylglucosamine O-acyltransferase [Acidobacteriota bacterium]